jgi:UDP-N-acetyl-D-mannosaminuronic acid dehydrogenase
MTFKRISVMGLGYIGLPTAAMIASRGVEVVGVDVDARVVDLVNHGLPQFTEPDLALLLERVVASGKLRATTTPEPADAFVLAVPTPFQDGHVPDLRYIEAASRLVAPLLKPGDLVVLESTSPVGTTERMIEWMAEVRSDLRFPTLGGDTGDIFVAHCPERVLPGRILVELVENDRVIGGVTRACVDRAARLYELFVNGSCLKTDARTAEMVKLTENAYRDVNIALANELSLVCDRLDVDVWELIALANRHPRVDILQPGPGVGGHCIAVDPWFIVHSAPEETPLLQVARAVNDGKPARVVDRIMQHAERRDAPVVTCLGLTYKADIEDVRESAAVKVVQGLVKRLGQRVLVVEPNVYGLPEGLARHDVELVDLEDGLRRADVVALLVDHSVFRAINRDLLRGKDLVDTRGLWRQLN